MADHDMPTGWTLHDTAIISPSGRYRYWLRRRLNWIMGDAPVVFCMLNPSTADATEDDPTIRRCIGYANQWGASDLVVVNLFALRSTDPAALFADGVSDPEGPDNDTIIRYAAEFCAAHNGTFVCAWGSAGKTKAQQRYVADRAATVLGIIEDAGCEPTYLRRSEKTGQPGHPLYLPANLKPRRYRAMLAASEGGGERDGTSAESGRG